MKAYQEAVYYSKDARQTYVRFSTAVGIPSGVAFVIGIIIGIISGALALMADSQFKDALEYAAVFGGLAALVAFLACLAVWREFVTGVEMTLTAIAYPNVAVEPVRVEYTENSGRTLQIEKMSCTRGQMIAVAAMYFGGNKSLPIGALKSIFTDADARQFQAELIQNGYAVWKHPDAHQQGIRITKKGEAVMREYNRKRLPSPTLPASRGVAMTPYAATHAPHTPDWGYDD